MTYQIWGFDGNTDDRVLLHECNTQGEGISWGRGYTCHGDFGGWTEIVLLLGTNTRIALWDIYEGEHMYPSVWG